LRHVRAFWDIARHRSAPEVNAVIERLRSEGRLHVHAGRLQGVEREDGLTVCIAPRRSPDRPLFLDVTRIVNATGPESDLRRSGDRLVRELLRSGLARADAYGLGFETREDARLVTRDGSVRAGLFAVGPLSRGATFEATAVPELREVAHAAAAEVLRTLDRAIAEDRSELAVGARATSAN
jgi:uncharacterized NAD(P)/FAD-binding protein YdhS